MRWSENETHQFVKIYLSHECLWNSSHKFYKLKDKRFKAYRDIIAALNETTGILLSDAELKIKIKNLRSTYSQEILKIKQRSGPTWTYTPNMKWFMEWHKCFTGKKKPLEDSSFESNQDISDDPCPKIWHTQSEDNLENETLDPFPEADDEYIILKPEPREVPQVNTDGAFRQMAYSDNRYESKKKKIKHRSPSTDCLTFTESTHSNTDSLLREDEFDIYGKYIAAQLRKMDLQKALRVQLEIQSLVSEARISEMNDKQ